VVLAALLGEQQASSRYPLRWPLPFPVEDFLVRPSEERAWVAELDGLLLGHVAVGRVVDADAAQVFSEAGASDPASVSVLFTALAARGTGTGRLLLDTAVAWIRSEGRQPVLDVLPTHGPALAVYRHLGWVEVGTTRPPWLPADHPDELLMLLP
jgi:GNAT superfamily N-acetyltransferase